MPERMNDPQRLDEWMAKMERRLRMLEARYINPGDGLTTDYANKTMHARISDDPGNAATIGEDGGIYTTDTVNTTSLSDHTPLIILKEMTASQTIGNAADTLVSWGSEPKNTGFTTSATTITIPEAGDYIIHFQWQWANNATGIRGLKITNNSTNVATGSILSDTFPVVSNNEAAHSISAIIDFAGGEVLRCYVFQSSGANLGGGGPYFGDIRGRWQVAKYGDAFNPTLITE